VNLRSSPSTIESQLSNHGRAIGPFRARKISISRRVLCFRPLRILDPKSEIRNPKSEIRNRDGGRSKESNDVVKSAVARLMGAQINFLLFISNVDHCHHSGTAGFPPQPARRMRLEMSTDGSEVSLVAFTRLLNLELSVKARN